MTCRTKTTFTCNCCGCEASGEPFSVTPSASWRVLTWQSGYQGAEKREAHYCGTCHPLILKALDVILEAKCT